MVSPLRFWASLVGAGVCAWWSTAGATAQAAEPVAVSEPAMGSGPSDKALERVAQEARAAGVDRAVLEAPLAEARRAVRRAAGARAAGDSTHATMLDGLAGEWAEVARTLLRAARVEAAARGEAERARDLGVRLERTRALIVEQQAHRWRLRAELDRYGDRSRAAAGDASGRAPAKPPAAAKADATRSKSTAPSAASAPPPPPGGAPSAGGPR
jgi:hypothetical protein